MPSNSRREAKRGALRCLVATFVVLLLTGCGTLLRDPVPLEAKNDPSVPGFTDIRFYPLTEVEPMRKAIRQAFLTETPDNYETLADGWRRYHYLAISGGGSDGAFGAGILNGWSAKGNRPTFKVVTGVSTGALIAPLAFLGSAHDPQIKEAYTTVNRGEILVQHDLISMLWEESVADNGPLKALVTTYITPEVLDAIAVEHAKGRRLYVASTNMDREEPVIWDMGAIASSKDPAKLELFRSVLVASASIPAIFPPTLIKVNLDGRQYDEMHCDGGVFFQSFFIGVHRRPAGPDPRGPSRLQGQGVPGAPHHPQRQHDAGPQADSARPAQHFRTRGRDDAEGFRHQRSLPAVPVDRT